MAAKPMVLIDFRKNGEFVIYSDDQTEVIVRCAHHPGEELVHYETRPIPRSWLRNKPVGFRELDTIEERMREILDGRLVH